MHTHNSPAEGTSTAFTQLAASGTILAFFFLGLFAILLIQTENNPFHFKILFSNMDCFSK